MLLNIQGDQEIESPTGEQIANALASLSKQREGFAILSRSDLTYIQAGCSDGDSFVIEYQEDTTSQHYYCHAELSTEEVIKAFLSYATEDGWWKSGIEWHRTSAPKTTKRKFGLRAYFPRLNGWSVVYLLGFVTCGICVFAGKRPGANINIWLSAFFCSVATIVGVMTTECLLKGRFRRRYGTAITRADSPIQFWINVVMGYVIAMAVLLLAMWRLWLAPLAP
jgi:hypothetical protein